MDRTLSEHGDHSHLPPPSLNEMADEILAEKLSHYLSGATGQGETHERGIPQDPSFSVFPPPQLFHQRRLLSELPEYPPRLLGRIPDQFSADFLRCSACHSLSIAGWYDHLNSPEDDYTDAREEGYYILFVKDLEETWEQCPICRILRDLILPLGKENENLHDSDVVEYAKVRPGFGGNGNVTYTREYDDGGFQTFNKRLCYSDEGMRWLNLPLDIRPAVWPQFYETDPVENIKKWLLKCRSSHTSCSNKPNANLSNFPARLLDIGTQEGDPNKVIALQQEQSVDYIALSYCWGTTEFPKLTSATVEAFSHDVDWDKMPLSWQDAICVAEKTGVRYLWIDALCILQDSSKDWATESSKMADIYEKACFVISADVSSGNDVGLFEARQIVSRLVDLPQELRPDQPDLVLTVCKQSEGGFPDPVHDLFWTSEWGYNGETLEEAQNHTFHRGWCLQERYLATRVVHFTSTEMFWECREKTYCECGFSPRDRSPRKREFHKCHLGIISRDERRFVRPPDPWWELLREYTARKLSFDSDRLAALSGLAREFQDTEKSEYLAGIWRGRMPYDLLWSAHDSRKTNGYVAPTWSWASIVGPVTRISGEEIVTCAEVTEAVCEVVGPDPYGQLEGGFLRLQACVIHGQATKTRQRRRKDCNILEEDEDEAESESGSAFEDVSDHRERPMFDIKVGSLPEDVSIEYCSVDHPDPPEFSRPVSLVPLVRSDDSYYKDEDKLWLAWGLLLVPSEKWPGAFERIGVASGCKIPKDMFMKTEIIMIR